MTDVCLVIACAVVVGTGSETQLVLGGCGQQQDESVNATSNAKNRADVLILNTILRSIQMSVGSLARTRWHYLAESFAKLTLA